MQAQELSFSDEIQSCCLCQKMTLTIFWYSEGIVHMEFLKQGNTVNSQLYISTLRKLSVRLKRLRPTKHAILHHNNARPHTSRQTEEALHKMKFVVLPHPSYSPDLAPSDFYLFPKLKEQLKGNHYESDEDVEAVVRHWFRQKKKTFSPMTCVNLYVNGSCVWIGMETTLKKNLCMI
ncbi:transposase [Elysia marginata]|uniref:Transposase n=1 Tax=Elysia marginata TaxID=1093978 RepID=A0AAV4G416_9GAST|nr:transposase [Elysia marginata]